MKSLKTIMARGLLITFSCGVLGFLFGTLIGVLSGWWNSTIMAMTGSSWTVAPLAAVFTAVIILFVGYVFTNEWFIARFKGFGHRVPLLNWFLDDSEVLRSVNDMPGALLEFHDGCFFIAALIGTQMIEDKLGCREEFYKLYCPSAPVPWSGMPIIFAQKQRVTPINISFGRVYGITTSFGRSTPDVLKEIA